MPDIEPITLREFLQSEIASIRRDIATLDATIIKTASAHESAHDRDHKQTELATAKAESALTERLKQMKEEAQRVDDERKRQIEDIKGELSKQSQWQANVQGKGAAFIGILGVVSIVGFLISLWSAFSPS